MILAPRVRRITMRKPEIASSTQLTSRGGIRPWLAEGTWFQSLGLYQCARDLNISQSKSYRVSEPDAGTLVHEHCDGWMVDGGWWIASCVGVPVPIERANPAKIDFLNLPPGAGDPTKTHSVKYPLHADSGQPLSSPKGSPLET